VRRWLQRRQGSMCPKPRTPFFWFTSIWIMKRPISVEVSAPTRLGLRGSHVWRKFRQRTTLRSESSTIKGLLYAPIQQKQYLKRTTLRRLKIPLQSICSKEGPHYHLGAKRERESCHLTSNNQPLITSWKFLGDSILGLYRVAWLTQESVSSRIFVRKKGMNHVQSNRRSQQTPSAKLGKEKTYRWWSYYQVPTSVLLWETHAFCSRNMGVHVRYTSAKKLVSSDFAKILEVATKLRETYEKTLFTPPSPTKATNSIVSV
jgi:hypothetical protein